VILPGKQIAPLLLIPFLENAFKHGTSEQLEQAWIFLDLSVDDNVLTFKLVNSRDTDTFAEKSVGATSVGATSVGGIGLQNVRKAAGVALSGSL
jgi:sensor histidine kinase YesM